MLSALLQTWGWIVGRRVRLVSIQETFQDSDSIDCLSQCSQPGSLEFNWRHLAQSRAMAVTRRAAIGPRAGGRRLTASRSYSESPALLQLRRRALPLLSCRPRRHNVMKHFGARWHNVTKHTTTSRSTEYLGNTANNHGPATVTSLGTATTRRDRDTRLA